MTNSAADRYGNFFEDFKLGQIIRHATPRTITDGECALYIALTGARQPLYCAETVARALGFGRVRGHPPLLERRAGIEREHLDDHLAQPRIAVARARRDGLERRFGQLDRGAINGFLSGITVA